MWLSRTGAAAVSAVLCSLLGPYGLARAEPLRFGPAVRVDNPVSVAGSGPAPSHVTPVDGLFFVHGGGLGYRIGAGGRALDLAPFPIPEGAVSCGRGDVGPSVCVAVDGWRLRRFALDGVPLAAVSWLEGASILGGWLTDRWMIFRGGEALRWFALGADGVVRDDTHGSTALATSADAVACAAGECLVVYRDTSSRPESLRGGYVRADGVHAWFGFEISDTMTGPGDYAVGVVDEGHVVSQRATGELRAVRVGDRASPGPPVVDGSSIRLATDALAHPACHGASCLVVAHGSTEAGDALIARQLGGDGVLGPETVSTLLGAIPDDLSVGCEALRCLITWSEGPERVFHHLVVDRAGEPLDGGPVRPILEGNGQAVVALAAGASSELVVVSDERGVGASLRASRVSDAGSLDTVSLPLGEGAGPAGAAFARGDFGVVWAEAEGLRFVRFAETGPASVSPVSIATAASASALALTASGDDFFLAWVEPGQLLGARVTEDGLLGAPTTLRIGDVLAVDASASAEGIWIAWTERDASSAPEVWAQRLDLDGVARGEAIPVGGADAGRARIAAAHDGALVVWTETRATETAVRAARVVEAEVLDADGLAIREALDVLATAPAATFDGEAFVVVWEERTRGEARTPRGPPYLAARRVALDGTTRALTRLGPRESPCPPEVTSRGGSARVATCAFDAAPAVRARRAEVIPIVVEVELAGACERDADCASRHCVAGRCCDRACGGACEACTAAGICALRPPETVCRPAVDACDLAERCTGERASCPFDRRGVCPPAVDAGGAEDSGATPGPAPGPTRGCACRASGAGDGAPAFLAWLAIVSFARAARRRG